MKLMADEAETNAARFFERERDRLEDEYFAEHRKRFKGQAMPKRPSYEARVRAKLTQKRTAA
jgi:hypothetical protein